MTMRRTRDPARPSGPAATPAPRVPLPHHEISLPARLRRLVTPSRKGRAWPAKSRKGRAWPATIVVIALIVFAVSWAQTTVLMALIVALTTLVAGVVLVTLIFGTPSIIEARRRSPSLPGDR